LKIAASWPAAQFRKRGGDRKRGKRREPESPQAGVQRKLGDPVSQPRGGLFSQGSRE
jgi:hypothetical protein